MLLEPDNRRVLCGQLLLGTFGGEGHRRNEQHREAGKNKRGAETHSPDATRLLGRR